MEANDPLRLSLLESEIRTELDKLSSKEYPGFTSHGAFLFLPAPYSGLFEPAFVAKARAEHYDDLFAVDSKTGTPATGIATLAYKKPKGVEISQDPNKDPRLGAGALDARAQYGITGAMMACRIDDGVGECLGIVVVYEAQIERVFQKVQTGC